MEGRFELTSYTQYKGPTFSLLQSDVTTVSTKGKAAIVTGVTCMQSSWHTTTVLSMLL